MIEIYDKSFECTYVDGKVDDDVDVDANGCTLTLHLVHLLWGRIAGKIDTQGSIDWSQVKILSHPKQLAYMETAKLQVDADLFKVFENFQGNVKWTVDDKCCRDIVQMTVGDKTGFIIRLQFI